MVVEIEPPNAGRIKGDDLIALGVVLLVPAVIVGSWLIFYHKEIFGIMR